MQNRSIFNLIFAMLLLSCESNYSYESDFKNSVAYNFLLLDVLAKQNDKFTFQNYKYSYSSMISRNIGGSDYSICVDIYKTVTLDENKIITGYEGNTMPNKCYSSIPIQFRCIKDVLLVIEVHNFQNEINTNLRNHCKTTLEGVVSF
ncbi:hypothetical protein [Leptospira mtsangambouensis]|uniref:hypothetical protein n=1 Tax=Leptospira mtsangambouensis TaxID=2484912 RepID=UPI001EECC3AE|nr:hypothetical protein [Leptospira mtsangambouensis]MCG6140636.1 hypothetical protein [Leptospira mtsangambouensis]